MASLNPLTRELVLKLVFYGPGLGGKTTTLEYIHAATKAENRGQMISLATTTDRTLYFDFLPLRVPKVRGLNVRLQLFTVPGQVYYAATRRLVLSGADGLVFVADSQAGRMEANEESLEDLNANLTGHGKALAKIPHTFHWNKRDLSDLVPLEELDRRLNVHHAPSLGTCATRGDGVFEGLERITRMAIANCEAEMPKSGEVGSSGEMRRISQQLVAPRAASAASAGGAEVGLMAEGGPGSIAEAIRAHAEAPPVGDPASGTRPGLQQKVTPFPGTTAPGPKSSDRMSAVPQTRPQNGTLMSLGSSVPSSVPRTDRESSPPAPDVAAPFSMAELWPKGEREEVRQAESLLGARDAGGAVLACELLFSRVLASVPGLASGSEAQIDQGVGVLLLGLDGRRYLAFRASVRAARLKEPVSMREALECYAFVNEARGAREGVGR